MKTPFEPLGIVRSIPGLRARKREVVTRRSVFVRTKPRALAIREYTRKNTRAWKATAICPVFPFINLRLRPDVVSNTPGLNTKKRLAGIATFCDVTSGNI